jgi:endoglucanase
VCTFGWRAGAIAALFITVTSSAAGQYFRGVNVSQAEWGDPWNSTYGSSYAYPTAPTFDYFAARGLPFIRLQVQWERLQPVLGAALDPTQLQYLQQDVAYAKASGALISIVPHNSARYAPNESFVANPCIIDNPCPGSPVQVTSADLANFWVNISNAFKDEPAVAAYDLMNEPYSMGVANWGQIAQTVVTAIRNNGDTKLLMIPGDSYSNATAWASVNGSTPFITDPANNYYYEAHEYFDSDYSGTYEETYDQELAANASLATIGVTRLQPFVAWCQANSVPCYVGEYGIPNTDPRWLTVLSNFLMELDAAGMPGTYWAAGELWQNYPLSVQPANDFTTDAEQMGTLLGHLQPASFVTVSSAAVYGWASAPGELVTGYGSGLAAGTQQAAQLPLPTEMQGAQVQLTDSAGNVLLAPLLFVSTGQINYQVPSGVAPGMVTVAVLNGAATVATGLLEVQSFAPSIFTLNEQGTGVPAALIQRVHPDGTYDYEGVDAPIAFNGDNLYLLLYGTGFDAASQSDATVIIGGVSTTLTYAGPAPGFAGEDQIDAQLPSSLAGAGYGNPVTVYVVIDQLPANQVTLTFQ